MVTGHRKGVVGWGAQEGFLGEAVFAGDLKDDLCTLGKVCSVVVGLF